MEHFVCSRTLQLTVGGKREGEREGEREKEEREREAGRERERERESEEEREIKIFNITSILRISIDGLQCSAHSLGIG